VYMILALLPIGCRGVPQQPIPAPAVQVSPPAGNTPPARVENDLDRSIRVQLETLLAQETLLKERDISFSINGGDVTVTGIVRSDAEREKTNEIAINVPGVRSVANALRVSQ
jgi:hypothetical protein